MADLLPPERKARLYYVHGTVIVDAVLEILAAVREQEPLSEACGDSTTDDRGAEFRCTRPKGHADVYGHWCERGGEKVARWSARPPAPSSPPSEQPAEASAPAPLICTHGRTSWPCPHCMGFIGPPTLTSEVTFSNSLPGDPPPVTIVESAPPPRTFCPQCGPDMVVDEDGCCAACGATATGGGVDRMYAEARDTAAEVARLTRERDSLAARLRAEQSLSATLLEERDRERARAEAVIDQRDAAEKQRNAAWEELKQARAELAAARAGVDELCHAVENAINMADTDEDSDGFISRYHFATGPVHRLLAKVRDPRITALRASPPVAPAAEEP